MHPGFVRTGLGIETADGFSSATVDAYAGVKAGWGAIPVSEGADTVLWAVGAQDGVIPSGKLLYLRKVHTF